MESLGIQATPICGDHRPGYETAESRQPGCLSPDLGLDSAQNAVSTRFQASSREAHASTGAPSVVVGEQTKISD